MKKNSWVVHGVMALMAVAAQAAPITWSTPANLAGNSDVLATGAGIFAYTGGTAATVNGVAFTATLNQSLNDAYVSVSGFTANSVNAFTTGSAPFSGLLTEYKNILIGAPYNDSGAVATVTLKNLIPGAKYKIQLWISDPRGSNRAADVTSSGGNTVNVDYTSPTDAAGNPGQYTIGTFTADSTSQTLTIDGNASTQLNAIQLRYETYVMNFSSDTNWWTAAAWSGSTWANNTVENPSYAYLNVGSASPTMWVTNAANLASSDVSLAGLYVKGSNGALAINGSNMTFTSNAPFIDLRSINAASSELRIRNYMTSLNPISIYSVGTEPGGGGYTGGIRFEKTPGLGTIRMKSGHLLMYDASADTFTDTVILDGGGICSQNKATGFNFPVKVGAAGGWWRTYGGANMIVGGTISDEAPGVTGEFRHTDGGTMTITNSLAGFNGVLRNNAGTMYIAGSMAGSTGTIHAASGDTYLTGNALNFAGTKVLMGSTFRLGNGDTISDSTFSPPIVGGAGTFVVNLNGGKMALTSDLIIGNYLDKYGTSLLELSGAKTRTSAGGGFSIYAGTLEMKEGSFTGPGELSIRSGGKMVMTGGTATFGNRMETQKGGDFVQNGGFLKMDYVDVAFATNTINNGTLQARFLNLVNYNDGRFPWFIQNGGTVILTATNKVVNSADGNTASNFRIGHWGSGKGTLILNGGELQSENQTMNISWDSPGQVDITNGVLKCYSATIGCPGKVHQADLKMFGGTLKIGAGGIYRRASNATMSFYGGTLASAAPFTINGVLTVGDSADDLVSFDTTEGTITAPNTISGSGKLVKAGTGKLRFSDLQTAVQVNAGEIEPTYYAVSVPSITSTAAGATFDLQLASTAAGTSTKYTASGNIVLADETAFDVTLYQGTYQSGVAYTLMESTGGTIATNGSIRVPLFEASRSAVAFTLSGDSKKLYMTITDSPYTLYWKGADATGNWNTTETKWSQNPLALDPDEEFQPLDNVIFSDVSVQSTVAISITPDVVIPKTVMVSNTASTAYTLTGSGISGGALLAKAGQGTLTFDAPWLSVGTITLLGGTIDWRDDVSFSASKLSVASGATFKQNDANSVITASGANLWSGANLILGAGTFNITAGSNVDPLGSLRIEDGILRCAGANMSKSFTVAGTTGGIDFRTAGTGDNTISGTVTGNGSLTVYANGDTSDSGGGNGGSLTLSNTGNSFTGSVVLAAGVVKAESKFGDVSNPVVLNGGGTVQQSGTITITRDLLVGPLGGVLRCYGNQSYRQTWTGKFADRILGVTGGNVSSTDGGTIEFTGDISGFTGNYRKAAGGCRLLIGNGGALPCDNMKWASIYINGDRTAFNLSNTDFKVGFSTTGNGALYKQGTGSLLWTNNVANAIAHTGGTFIEGGAIKMQDATQFAENTTVTISSGATLERTFTTAMDTGKGRRIAGAGTFKLTLAADCGANIYTNSTGFNGTLDLSCIGPAKMYGLATNQFGGNTTINVNTGALWYVFLAQTYPYKMKIAGVGNTEVGGAYSFGALRLETNPILTGAIALSDDARIYGSATLRGVISNDCPTVKTLSFGGTYAQGHTMHFYGPLVNGRAPLNLAFTHANTFNFYATNSVSAVTNNNSTLNIKSGAKLAISQPTGGTGAWAVEANGVMGLVIAGSTGGSLNASALTWNASAKVSVAGLNTTDRVRIPLIRCPSASITGLPQLAEALTPSWVLSRADDAGVATIYAIKQSGALIMFK